MYLDMLYNYLNAEAGSPKQFQFMIDYDFKPISVSLIRSIKQHNNYKERETAADIVEH